VRGNEGKKGDGSGRWEMTVIYGITASSRYDGTKKDNDDNTSQERS